MVVAASIVPEVSLLTLYLVKVQNNNIEERLTALEEGQREIQSMLRTLLLRYI